MKQTSHPFTFPTNGKGFTNITDDISDWLTENNVQQGIVTLFIRHTSASLTIQENADPSVRVDLLTFLEKTAPKEDVYTHADEGPDDMPAHIKSMLTDVSLTIPVHEGKMTLGTWQGIYLVEHRSSPHQRKIHAHFIGE